MLFASIILGVFDMKFDGKSNELGMLLHQILHAALLQELRLILLQQANSLGAALNCAPCRCA